MAINKLDPGCDMFQKSEGGDTIQWDERGSLA